MAFSKYLMAMGWPQKEKAIQTDLDLPVPEQFFFFPTEISPKHVRAHMHTRVSIPTAGIKSY